MFTVILNVHVEINCKPEKGKLSQPKWGKLNLEKKKQIPKPFSFLHIVVSEVAT